MTPTDPDLRIVLVRPTHPGNIGAVARAMKTMALRRLYLVAPENFPSPIATDRAVGAHDVLEATKVCASLDEAITGCHCVIGTTARQRRIEWPVLAPEQAARRLVDESGRGPVALLFGQERTGLLNEELDRCQAVVTIPADPNYSSLNLASAVQILAYEIYRASSGATLPSAPEQERPVGSEQMRLFYEHLETVLKQITFLDPNNPRLLMRRLMRLFNRAGLDENELNILRGILTAVQQYRHTKN